MFLLYFKKFIAWLIELLEISVLLFSVSFYLVRSIFAWVAFNRDGFADNVSWRQAQKYQQKNYNISRPLLHSVNISGRTNVNISSTPQERTGTDCTKDRLTGGRKKDRGNHVALGSRIQFFLVCSQHLRLDCYCTR